jgi:repressor of nif and glnA expression
MEIRETAVKYLIKILQEQSFQSTHGSVKITIPENIIEDVLEREEEEIINAWEDGFQNGYEDGRPNCGENYYVDNFGYLR